MSSKSHHFLRFLLLFFITKQAQAVTLTSGQTDYTTSSDITTSASGIISTLSGSSSSLNKITNAYTITTGNSGATSSAYGIKSSGNYNQITNNSAATILTTGSSGRGISVADFSVVVNAGTISTQGTTSYGIYGGGNSNSLGNSGIITTANTTAYGIYANGDSNSVNNSGTITTEKTYGIYLNGNANSLINSGTITTNSGSSSHGIYVSAGTSSAASATSYSSVDNSGIITSTGHGIYAKDNYTQITNSGSITTASSSTIYGVKIEGDNSSLTNSGSITSTNYAIYNSGSNVTINNSGNLNGGVLLNSAVLNIWGGSISGEVDGSSGSGSVVIGSSSYPAITFNQLADFTDLDSLTISSNSTLNSNAAITANNIFIDANSTLTLGDGSSLSGAIKGVSDEVGTLNISAISFSASGAIGVAGNSLANLNINSGGSLTSSNDIYAADTFIDGTLNFNAIDNLTIFGNLAGGGSAIIDVGQNSQNISGNFSLAAGDILETTLKSGGVGNLSVVGSATIDSDSKLKITTSSTQGYISSGTQYNLVSAGSGSTINAISDSNISVNESTSNIYGLLKFTTQSLENNLVLNINRLTAAEVVSNKNSQNIYQNLSDISSSGKLLEFQTYLDNSGFSQNSLTQALNQIAPQSSKAALATSNNVVMNSVKIAETRLQKNRRNSAKNLLNGFWVEGFGASATQNQIADDEGYKANSLGFVIGSDKEISDETLVGGALSYVKSDIKSSDNTKQNLLTTHQISFYSGQNFEKYFFDSFAGAAFNQYSSSRSINAVSANATARYFGQTYALKIKGGLVKKLRYGFSISPEVSLNFLQNKIDGYSEKGADSLNLVVKGISANFLESRVGLNLDWVTTKLEEFPEFKKLVASAKISYGYSLINDAPTTSASFSGQTAGFNWQISHVDRGSLKLGGVLQAYHEEDATFSFDYDFERKTTYQAHFLALKLRQEF